MSSTSLVETELEGYRIALEDIAAGIGTCNVCGVEYAPGYEGPCQERLWGWEWKPYRCHGAVSMQSTAAKALKT